MFSKQIYVCDLLPFELEMSMIFLMIYREIKLISITNINFSLLDTGQPRYVKLAYLKYTAYVKVIIHSRAFPYIALYLKRVYVELGYHKISAISKWFSFWKMSFPLLYYYLCQSKFCVCQKIKQYECQTR